MRFRKPKHRKKPKIMQIDETIDRMSARERILKKIREALTHAPVTSPDGVDLERNVYSPIKNSPEEDFAEKFIAAGGAFLYCENAREAVETFSELVKVRKWQGKIFCKDPDVADLLDLAEVAYGSKAVDAVVKSVVFCGCRYLIAQDGSVVWNNASAGRRAMAQADDVVFVASVEQVMPDFRTAVRLMKEGKEKMPSLISRWTGMPCFFDIDGETMTGCGPRNVYLILIDNL